MSKFKGILWITSFLALFDDGKYTHTLDAEEIGEDYITYTLTNN